MELPLGINFSQISSQDEEKTSDENIKDTLEYLVDKFDISDFVKIEINDENTNSIIQGLLEANEGFYIYLACF